MHQLLLHLKAKFVVYFEATIQINWLQNFNSGLGIVDSIARPLKMYIDNILHTTNDLGLLHETKKFLSRNFEVKDMVEVSYVIGIEMFYNRSQ